MKTTLGCHVKKLGNVTVVRKELTNIGLMSLLMPG